jgi:ketosteroid isomerase-like protein
VDVSRETVTNWVAKYVKAWESYDPAEIGELFTEDATYQYHPFGDPIRGRDAIVASWLDTDRRDAAGTYEARYHPIAIDGDVAVVNGRTRYFSDSSQRELVRDFENIFVIRFDSAMRCRSFQEWYNRRPDGE